MTMSPARIEGGDGRYALQGALGFPTAPGLWQQLLAQGLFGRGCSVDLAGVTHADSAGLALLVAWRAASRAAGGEVHFTGVPERLQALAALTRAQPLLDLPLPPAG